MIRRLLTLCLAVVLTAQAGEAPFTGRFVGTGRACYGMLAVRTQTISWLTSFSQCQALPYELAEQTDSGGHLRITWRFTRSMPACRYELISLTHDGGTDQDIGWNVTGYGSEQSYLVDKRAGYPATRLPLPEPCRATWYEIPAKSLAKKRTQDSHQYLWIVSDQYQAAGSA